MLQRLVNKPLPEVATTKNPVDTFYTGPDNPSVPFHLDEPYIQHVDSSPQGIVYSCAPNILSIK